MKRVLVGVALLVMAASLIGQEAKVLPLADKDSAVARERGRTCSTRKKLGTTFRN
jgi:hypothetical protein